MSKNRLTNWSPEKKDLRDKERADRAIEHDKQKVLWTVTEAYKKLKKRLLKRKDGREKDDVFNFLLDLRNTVCAHLDKQGLEQHKDFALSLIDDKLAMAKATGINEKNVLTAYVPNSTYIDGPGVDPIAKHNATLNVPQATFSTMEELCAIPWVKKVMEQEGFVGLIIQFPLLNAFFTDEELVKIGFLANSVGVGKLPTWDEFRAAMIDKKAPGKDN